jgi:hypothetical protein
MSVIMLQSNYLIGNCQNEPVLINLFINYDLYSTKNYIDYPVYFNFTESNRNTPFPKCGLSQIKIPDQCCINSENIQESVYYSGLANIIAEGDIIPGFNTIEHYFPIDSNNYTYCNIQFNQTQIFVLSDGSFYNQYKCFTNGSFNFYNDTACVLRLETIQLNYTEADFSYENYSITALLVNITNATNYATFQAYEPLPLWGFYEKVSVSLYIISILFFVFVGGFSIYRYYKNPVRFNLLVCFTNILWLIYVILYPIFLVYYGFAYEQGLLILLGICVLLKVLESASLITSLRLSSNPELFRSIVYTFLFLLYFGLAGSSFVFTCNIQENCSESAALVGWRNCFKYWLFFMFFWDIIPAIIIPWVLLRIKIKNYVDRFQALFCSDPFYSIILIVQILLMAAYILLYILTTMNHLNNDKTLILLYNLRVTTLSLHAGLQLFLLDRVKVIVSKAIKYYDDKQDKLSLTKKSKESSKFNVPPPPSIVQSVDIQD